MKFQTFQCQHLKDKITNTNLTMWNISHEVYDTYVQTHFLKCICVEYAN